MQSSSCPKNSGVAFKIPVTPGRVLGGQGSDRAHGIYAICHHCLDIRLDTGASAGIASGDRYCCSHKLNLLSFVSYLFSIRFLMRQEVVPPTYRRYLLILSNIAQTLITALNIIPLSGAHPPDPSLRQHHIRRLPESLPFSSFQCIQRIFKNQCFFRFCAKAFCCQLIDQRRMLLSPTSPVVYICSR